MKIEISKLWELTSKKFLALTLISHVSLIYVLFLGSLLQIFFLFFLTFIIILLSSVPVYHRFLSHRSWNCPRWYEIFASFLGIFSFTGSTISRTTVHRQHHAFVDTKKDPHSPFFVSWYKIYFPFFNQIKIYSNLSKDLIKDPLHKFIHKFYLLIVLIGFLFVLIVLDLSWALTLTLAPGALCWANVCTLNIFGHKNIGGTNNKLLSIITLGEGNHKDHHLNPTKSNSEDRSFDLSYQIIKAVTK